MLLDDGTRKYVWGLGLAYAVPSSGGVEVYHTDGLGSVRAITDAAGTVIQTYQTDEFGIPTQTSGSSGQPFGYTGEQQDSTGLVYLRARLYDPQIGRFVQRDPYAGHIADPQSLNRHSYVQNNPVNLTDPSGLASQIKEPYLCQRLPTTAFEWIIFKECEQRAQAEERQRVVEACSITIGGVCVKTTLHPASDSEKLGRNLRRAGMLPGAGAWAAHHIVASGAKAAELSRKILEHYGIDINSAVNGMWLQQARFGHWSQHSGPYYAAVESRLLQAHLSGGGVTAILNTLASIRAEILRGTFPR